MKEKIFYGENHKGSFGLPHDFWKKKTRFQHVPLTFRISKNMLSLLTLNESKCDKLCD